MSLGDCCQIVSGATPKTSVPEYWDGDLHWATPADLSNLEGPFLDETPRKISAAGLASCAASILPAGSVLLSSRAPIGHVAINTRPMATNQGFKSLIPNADLVDSKYLFHWLRAHKRYLQSLGNGATFKEVSKATVSRVKLAVPPLDEQRRIAFLLDGADALRGKRRQTLFHLDALAQSIFLEMFGDPVGNPRELNTRILNDWVDSQSPITYGILKPGPDVPEGVPYVRVVDIGGDDMVRADKVKRTTLEIATSYQRSRLIEGDIVISIRGHVGRLGVVPNDLDGANITQDSARIRVPVLARDYVAAALNSVGLSRWMAKRTKGAAVRGINLGDLRLAPVPRPPDAEMRTFSRRVEGVRGQVQVSSQQRRDANDLFMSLQARAFAGRL